MILNYTSYGHKKVRFLCKQLELLTGMRLATNLSEDFNELVFISDLSYIVIAYEKNTCLALSHKITRKEWTIIEEIMIKLTFFWLGERYSRIIKKGGKNYEK